MAEHTIETRILLRYDTLSNWMNSNVILKQGEAAIAVAPLSYTLEDTNHRPQNTPPAVGIKIGDGYHYFSELPWVQGTAGDVYNWAKQQTKPIYNANEIQGLTSLIQEYINGSSSTEAKLYQLVRGTGENANKYFLQSKGINDEEWITDEVNFIDLTSLAELLQWLSPGIDEYWNINGYTSSKITEKLNSLSYTDNEDATKVVTAVDQINGQISVTRRPLSASNLSGIVSVTQGGTGRDILEQDSVLVGNGTNTVKLVPIDTELTNNTNFSTNKAIKDYIDKATSGLTGAMHYVGEATVNIINGSTLNPRIDNYNFSNVQYGDVITFDKQEYVWDGTWRLLGDEGSYAIKGSITNIDIAYNAEIDQSKIAGLEDALSGKVDKEYGKQLSSNDFTDEEKEKLSKIEDEAQRNIIEHVYVNGVEAIPTIIEGNPNSLSLRVSALTPEEEQKIAQIEDNAQENRIEHIFLNGVELIIGTVKSLQKSVNIQLNEFTSEEKQKLEQIEDRAQVNIIEHIMINDNEYQPNEDKEVKITLDEAALNLEIIKGARVLGPNGIYEDIAVSMNKKLELARIAKTGNIEDIIQTAGTYVILDCGTSVSVL